MAYLMHIGFDISAKFWKNIFYFEYKGIRYKLIQINNKKYCDVLLTVTPDINDQKTIDNAYKVASEYVSALSWELNTFAKVQYLGGWGCNSPFNLKSAKCSTFGFHEIPFRGYIGKCDITRLPEVENEQQRNALILFREAKSANNDYLAFMFYWQILEIKCKDPIGWIDKVHRKYKNKRYIYNENIQRLPLKGKTLGYYLKDSRDAIAHLFSRYKGKRIIEVDTPDDNTIISNSRIVIENFTMFYIENELNLKKRVYLVRKNGKGFPVYVNEDYIKDHYCKLAYEKPRTVS